IGATESLACRGRPLAGPEIPRNGAPVHLRPAIRPQNFGRGERHQAQNRSADIPETAAQPQRQARRRRHPRNRVDHSGAPSLPRRPDAANTRAQHAESASTTTRQLRQNTPTVHLHLSAPAEKPKTPSKATDHPHTPEKKPKGGKAPQPPALWTIGKKLPAPARRLGYYDNELGAAE